MSLNMRSGKTERNSSVVVSCTLSILENVAPTPSGRYISLTMLFYSLHMCQNDRNYQNSALD